MRWMNLEPIIQSEMSQKEKDKYCILTHIYGIQKNGTETSLVAQMVKHLSTVQETRVRSLGWEDPLEKGMTTHSSILRLP